MLGRGEVRWTDIAMPDFLRSPHLRKIIVYCNKIHLCQTQLNWNIIWILLFQICLKGSNIFKGYVNDPKETAETIDEDDWLHIGYIGLFISGLFLLKLSKQHWQKEHIISVSESNSHKLKGFFFFCFLSNGVFSLSFYFTKLKIIYSRCRISTYTSKKLTLAYRACLCLFLLFLTSVHPAQCFFSSFDWL